MPRRKSTDFSSDNQNSTKRIEPPIKNLEQIKVIAENRTNDNDDIKLCHTYGIFIKKYIQGNDTYWNLIDTYMPVINQGLNIKLSGNLDQYPLVKPGDIVRIHRLTFDELKKCPKIPTGLNVLAWRVHQRNPIAIHTSRKPTKSPNDEPMRMKLEILYSNLRTKIVELNNERTGGFFTVAGQLKAKCADKYGHLICKINDASGDCDLKVFAKNDLKESADHFEAAASIKEGEYLIATMVKFATKSPVLTLHLSANLENGKSIMKVDKDSILGLALTAKFDEAKGLSPRKPLANHDDNNEASQEQQVSQDSSDVGSQAQSQPRLRRSPRLNPETTTDASSQSDASQTSSTIQTTSPIRQNPPVHSSSPTHQSPTIAVPSSLPSQDQNNNVHQYKSKKLADLPKKPDGKFEFYNLAGQVRGQPQECRQFKNWFFQLYDGSRPITYQDYNLKRIDNPVEDCTTIIVYTPQKNDDINDHIDRVKTLKDGDLVYIHNVKAKWREGYKLSLEINPNSAHGKRIEVIDKSSSFGRQLIESLTPLDAEELYDEGPHNTSEDM